MALYPPQNQAQLPPGPPRAAVCVTQIEVRISCKGLLCKDLTSSSDPLAVLHMKNRDSKQWIECGRTERIQNTENPSFVKPIVVDYFFEEVQNVKCSIYDIDSSSDDLQSADFLGSIECTLGQIVAARTFSKPLGHPSQKNAGTVSLEIQEVSANKDVIYLHFKGEKLDKKDFLSLSDPYLEISRQAADGSFSPIHRSEVVDNTLNPTWKPMSLSCSLLGMPNPTSPLKVDCYDWDDDGSHDLIGTFMTSLGELMETTGKQRSWPCINPKKQKKKKSYQNSGIIHLTSCEVVKRFSFVDFISHGCQINFTVAIDFTASNGDPSQPSSLHYINPYEPNEYTKALLSVGEVCQDYDTDKLFPALGFGAQVPPEYSVSHEFALNFNVSNPYCPGLNGVLEAYQTSLRKVRLYGPTYFAPVIRHVSRFASMAAEEGAANSYFILLIITDGEITDMDATKNAIVHASRTPMSIIIVGVGNARFDNMEELDADRKRLASGGVIAERDIVQFVPFRDYKGTNPPALAKAVLAEVPTQVEEYFNKRKIRPNGM